MHETPKTILAILAIAAIAIGGFYSYHAFAKTDSVVVPIDNSLEKQISANGNEVVSLGYTEPNMDLTENKIVLSSAHEFLRSIPKGELVYVALVERIYHGTEGPASPAYNKPRTIEKVYLAGPIAYLTDYSHNDYIVTARTTDSITFYYSNEFSLSLLILIIGVILGGGDVALFYISCRKNIKGCNSHSCSG